jgi:hypothetical protein
MGALEGPVGQIAFGKGADGRSKHRLFFGKFEIHVHSIPCLLQPALTA